MKKGIALLLAVLTVFSSLPAFSFAEEALEINEVLSDEALVALLEGTAEEYPEELFDLEQEEVPEEMPDPDWQEEEPEEAPEEVPEEEAVPEEELEDIPEELIIPEWQAPDPEEEDEPEQQKDISEDKSDEEEALEDEDAEEYNDSEQIAVVLPDNLMPYIDDEDNDFEESVDANGIKAPKPAVGYYPTLDKPVVYVSWTDATINFKNVSNYRLQRRVDNGKWGTVATRKTSSYEPAGNNKGRFEYYDYKIEKGHVYSYRVQIIKSGKTKATSAVAGASTLTMSKVKASRKSNNQPKISWTQVSKASGYYVFRKLSTDGSYSSKPFKTITSGKTVSFTDTKVKNGKTYNYLVIPFKKVGSTRYAATYKNQVSFYAGLKAPTITKITQKNASVKITWKSVSGASGYQIYFKKAGSDSWTKVGSVSGKNTTTFTHKTKVTRSTSGKTNQYRVRAVGKLGSTSITGKYSAVKKIYRLASPGTLTLSKSSREDKVNVKWQKVTGAKKYYIYYRQAGTTKWSLKKVDGSVLKTNIPVTVSKKYEVKVQAFGNNFTSQGTAIKTITSKPTTNYYALLIGETSFYSYNKSTGKYQNENAARNTKDVSLIKNMLSNVTGPDGGKYKVTTATNKGYNEIKSLIQSTFANTTENDVSLFLISTHGAATYTDSSGHITGRADGDLWMPFMGTVDEMNNYANRYYYKWKDSDGVTRTHTEDLPLSTLASWLKTYVKGKVIVLIESCGAGAAIYSTDAEQNLVSNGTVSYDTDAWASKAVSAFAAADPGIPADPEDAIANSVGDMRVQNKFYVLAAARYGENSYGWNTLGNLFVVALYLGVGSKGNIPADTNGNNTVDLAELYQYIKKYDGLSSAKYLSSYPKEFQDYWMAQSNSYNDWYGEYIQHVQRYPASGTGSTYPLFKFK